MGGGGEKKGKNPLLEKKKTKKLFFGYHFYPKIIFTAFLIKKLAFLKILVAKISKTDKNWAHYIFLRLLFYVFIFQKNLQSVQKKMKKKMKKSIATSIFGQYGQNLYAQRLQVCAKTSSGLWPPKISCGSLWPPKNTV